MKHKVHTELFIDRELSWLEFNRRVLDESEDLRNPLLERCKFLAIFSTNLDEFFMIRVAGLLNQREQGVVRPALGGLPPQEEVEAILSLVLPMRERQWKIWSEQVRPGLEDNGIFIVLYNSLTEEEKLGAKTYFESFLLPVLTPLMVDPTHPFPFISNLSMNFAIILRREGHEGTSEKHFARLKIPLGLKRFFKIEAQSVEGSEEDIPVLQPAQPTASDYQKVRLVLLEEIIRANLGLLFPGMQVEEAYLFRVTRDADVEIAEDEAGDLLQTMEKATRQRRFGRVVRVVAEPGALESVQQLLMDAFEVEGTQLQELNFFGYSSLWEIASFNRPELLFNPFVPRIPEALQRHHGDIFAAVRETDILLYHPFDSFSPTVSFFAQAARDSQVVAIKATLYRVGSDSPIVAHLLEAAQNEIEVTVLVELKARFDEKSNIMWAKTLEAAGVHVVYGVKGLKTHAKLGLVIRREATAQGVLLRSYCHMSSGNYNHSTAKFYTDIAMFTCRKEIGSDMTRLFNRLTAIAPGTRYADLIIAPEFLRLRLYALLEREIQHRKAGKESRVRIKCNSVTDPAIITKLYEASHAGVQIDLLVRGICCLRPGVKDISENIRVTSVIGRFLEHSRVLWFWNDGSPEVFVGSADLMGRNLDRRVENYFPVVEPVLQKWIETYVLELQLADNQKKRILMPDGTWVREECSEDTKKINSQEHAITALVRRTEDFVERKTNADGPTQSLKKLVKAATKRLVN